MMPHAGNRAAGQFLAQIHQVLLQLIEGLPLRQVVWKLVQITQPHLAILPVGETERVHGIHLGEVLQIFNAESAEPRRRFGFQGLGNEERRPEVGIRRRVLRGGAGEEGEDRTVNR